MQYSSLTIPYPEHLREDRIGYRSLRRPNSVMSFKSEVIEWFDSENIKVTFDNQTQVSESNVNGYLTLMRTQFNDFMIFESAEDLLKFKLAWL